MPTTDETVDETATMVSFRDPKWTSARERIEDAIASDDLEAALDTLESFLEGDEGTRSIDDDLWLYRTLGKLRVSRDDPEGALAAYRRAFDLDPRRVDVLESLATLLVEEEREFDGATDVLEAALVHARDAFEPSQRAAIHRRLGELHLDGDVERAREHLRRAAELLQDDREAMRAILESLRATGDPVDTLEIRRRLAESFDDPDERADVYRELGDTWRDRFDAPDRALESYERAVDTAPTPELWERIRSTAEALGDADHRYEARLALAEHADDDETTADHLFEASVLARDDLGEPERALRGFEEVYELDPSRFEAFQAIESLLQAAEDWHRLEAAYRWALDSTREREDVEDDVRAILWFKLGELRESQLDAPREAIEAYREASDLFPESPKFHEAIVSVAKSQDEDAEIAERHLRALYELDPNRIDVLKRLGRLYLKRDELDAALCHLRAHDALGGHLDERASSFLEQFETGMYNSPDRTLGADLRREYLEPASFDPNLGRVFALLFPVLHDWTSEFRSEYGLDGDDYVDLDEPLAFNNIYRDVAGTLGWDQPPDLWRHAEYRALTKAALDEPAVIAGDDLFGSGDEKRIAFATAKTLFLLERPFYLLGLRDVSDLQAFFLLALQMVRPEVEFERDEAMEEAYQTMDRAIEGDQRDQLRDAIDAATDESDEIDLQGWVETVEDAANRAGLLLAGDLEVARMHLESETDSFSDRSVETRLHELVTYSLSDDYLALRDALGISVA